MAPAFFTPIFTLLAAQSPKYEYIQPGGVAFNVTAILVGLLLGGLLACILTVFFHASVGKIFRTLISFRAFRARAPRPLPRWICASITP